MGWIIHPIGVGDQRIEQRADFQKLMPIAAGARQSRHLDAEHETDIAQADFGDEPLKAQAALDAGPGAPEIVVDDDDLFPPPAVLRGPIGERVLQPGRFLVALNLLNRGLADVHDRQTVLVASKDLSQIRPLRRRTRLASFIRRLPGNRGLAHPMQGHLSQHNHDAAPAFAGQPLPNRRRQIAHREIQANAPTRTALGNPIFGDLPALRQIMSGSVNGISSRCSEP